MSRDKKPQISRVSHPGKGLYEQVEEEGERLYAFYYPPNEVNPVDHIEYDSFHPIDSLDDDQAVIHHVPMKRVPWMPPGKPVEPDPDLWDRVKAFIWNHVDLPDERLYDLVAAYVYASWIIEAFNVVPYLQIIGPKASGKTRLGEVIQCLSYRGVLSSNISEAALFRCVEEWHPSLILDETEIYTNTERSSIQNLLNAGNRRGASAIRCGGEDRSRLDFFDVYGFKTLIGTGGFKDTLESRAIRISMEKNTRSVARSIDQAEAKQIRSMLLMWRFRRLADIASVESVGSVGLLGDTPPKGLDFADGRFAELYSPLLNVANHGYEAILSYAKDAYKYMVDEEGTTIEAEVVESVLNSASFVESGWISTQTITNVFNENRAPNEQWKNSSIGRVMKRLGFRPVRRGKGAGYYYDQTRINRLAKRYRVPTPETPTRPTLPTLGAEKQ